MHTCDGLWKVMKSVRKCGNVEMVLEMVGHKKKEVTSDGMY